MVGGAPGEIEKALFTETSLRRLTPRIEPTLLRGIRPNLVAMSLTVEEIRE